MSAPDPVEVKVPFEYCADPAIGTAPTSWSSHGAGGVVGGGGCDPPVTVTLLITAVVVALVEWLVTGIPMKTDDAIGIVSVPTTVHVLPSLDSEAVKRSPLRCRRTHRGGADVEPAVLTEMPPVESRRWNATPFAADATIIAWAEPALSVSRIIAPAFDQLFAF